MSIDMGEQFSRIIEPRLDSLQEKAGAKVAGMIEERMKSNVDAGVGFGADPYDPSYSDSHARVRNKKGFGSGRVNLQMSKKRIKQTKVSTTDGATQIKFEDEMVDSKGGGRSLFRMHHEGTAKGGKTRSIWPKSPESIPDDIRQKTKEIVKGVLRG